MPLDKSAPASTLHYGLLFLAHLICVDDQIHIRELKLLQAMAQELGVNDLTMQEIEKILVQDEKLVSWDQVMTSVPTQDRYELMWQGLVISHIDGFYSEPEKNSLSQLAQQWGITRQELNLMLTEAEQFAHNVQRSSNNYKTRLSIGAQFLKRIENVVSRSKIDQWTSQMPERVHRYLESLYQEMLLSGPEYEASVKNCARIAKEDYRFVEPALQKTRQNLENVSSNLQTVIAKIDGQISTNGTSESANELIKSFEETRSTLKEKIIQDIAMIQQALLAKQRTLQYFTIAFMGKTKVGKSTLHAIITGEGWDAIGVGRQRTTRFNRVYEWKNIRVIDTPGIGAPGGKSDEEIAQSILDEADTICYVVTNDSIQEVEFQFLKLLKEKSKPLIILLNIKQNLLHPKRLERFLQNPKKIFNYEGLSGIGGHIERIKRYAQDHYSNDFFEIIPVMLLAAQMSRDERYREKSKTLFKASHIQDFLDSIRLSLLEYGTIRRSQTLLGSTVGSIEAPQKWILEQSKQYQTIASTLNNKRTRLEATIKQARDDVLLILEQEISSIFQDVFLSVPQFSEEYWESSEHELARGWEKRLKSLQFQENLKLAQEKACQQYQENVQEAIVELGTELEMIYRLQTSKFSFWGQGVLFFERDFFRITGMIFMASGAILALFFPPLGLLGLLGGLLSWVSGWFQTRDQKRKEAVHKISTSLRNQLKKQKKQMQQQATQNLYRYCDEVEAQVTTYFDYLTEGLIGISQQLGKTQQSLADSAHYLNKAYAKRIVDWASGQSEELTDVAIQKTIRTVERNFGEQITIHLHAEPTFQRQTEEIQKIIQEKISIQY